MELIKFIFSGFWHFIGFLIILYMPLQTIIILTQVIMRRKNIKQYGYPPLHCDSDGDFKKEIDK